MSELSKIFRKGERFFKKLFGKYDKEFASLGEILECIIEKEILERIEGSKERAWAALESYNAGLIPRAAFDAAVKALTDAIKDLGD